MSTRDYGRVYPEFWTGRTGKIIRLLGRDAQVVSLYLLTCPSANMIGIYYLPLPTLCHEIDISPQGAIKALQSLSEAGFCYYEGTSEQVWVPEMARFQIGEELKPEDNRVKGLIREIEKYKKSRFYEEFIEKYNLKYHLNLESPCQAPAKPLPSQEQELPSTRAQQEHSSCAELSEFAPAETSQNGQRPAKRKGSEELPEQALTLAEKLKDSLLANIPSFIPPSTAQQRRWAVDINKLNRVHNKTWEQIEWLLAWSQKDPFWSANIQSGAKFRKQWNQLLAKASKEQPKYSAPLAAERQEDDFSRLARETREAAEQKATAEKEQRAETRRRQREYEERQADEEAKTYGQRKL